MGFKVKNLTTSETLNSSHTALIIVLSDQSCHFKYVQDQMNQYQTLAHNGICN